MVNSGALAVTAGVGRFGVNRRRNQLDEAIQQLLLRFQKLLVVERDGGLRCQGFDQRLDITSEDVDLIGIGVDGVEKLQHADDLILRVPERHAEE